MKIRKILYTILASGFACISSASAQSSATGQIHSDSNYIKLNDQTKRLKQSEDSVQTLIARNRTLFENRPDNKDTYAAEVVRLEGVLYDIRSNISKIAAQIFQVEQEYISRNISNSDPSTPNSDTGNALGLMNKESRNLFNNYFFVSNLSKAEIAYLSSSAQVEKQIASVQSAVNRLYKELGELKDRYDKTTSQNEVDTLFVQAKELKTRITATDNQIAQSWQKLFNQKIDTYLVLIDKLKGVDRLTLEQIDQKSRAVRREEAFAAEQLAPNTVLFQTQKRLALDYEVLLAQNLDLNMALDSLSKQIATLTIDKPSYPDITFAPRNLIVYGAITLTGKYSYSSVDSIPEIKIPKTGIYYAIQVAAMAKAPAALSFFKGGEPLQVEKLTDGRLRYTLGGFTSYAEAQKGVNQLIKAGFKAPVMMAWVNGVFTPSLKAKAEEANIVKSAEADGKIYKIEIKTNNAALSTALKEIVDMHAKGKQMTRMNQGSNYIFTVLQFATKAEAEVVAQIIRDKNREVTVIVEAIE